MTFADNELLHTARKERAFWNAFLQFWEHLGNRVYGDSAAPLNTCVDLSSQVTAGLIFRAIELPSVVRMTGDQAAAYVKFLPYIEVFVLRPDLMSSDARWTCFVRMWRNLARAVNPPPPCSRSE